MSDALNKNKGSFIETVLIIVMLYMSGSIFFVSFYYSQCCILIFVFMTAVYIMHGGLRQMSKNVVFSIILLALCILTVIIINNTDKYYSYIAVFLQLLMAAEFAEIYGFERFKKLYVKIISVFAVVSLIGYAITVLRPTVMLLFPKTDGEASLDYYNAIIHVFASARGYSRFVPFLRNSGIFWEPGAYQAFLNLGILFFLDDLNPDDLNRKSLFGFFCMILAVLTTFSTTGYILLFILLLSYIKKTSFLWKRNTVIFIAVIIGFALFLVFINKRGLGFDFMGQKITDEISDKTYGSRLDLSDISIIVERPLGFLGISFETFSGQYGGAANSILNTAICLGLPFTVILIFWYCCFASKCFEGKSLVAIVFLTAVFLTESLIWRPVFLILAWYGAIYKPLQQTDLSGEKNENINSKLC